MIKLLLNYVNLTCNIFKEYGVWQGLSKQITQIITWLDL
jgi:hypothetical protein